MFPGYITLYRDNKGLTHLYFFRGLCDNGTFYYQAIDTSDWIIQYEIITYSDDAVEYIFNVDVKRVICKLIDNSNNIHTVELKIKSGN